MLIAIALAGSIVTAQDPAKWDLKPYLADQASTSWDTVVDAKAQGESHSAAMTFKIQITGKSGDELAATYSWKDTVIDGGKALPDQDWDVTLDPTGGLIEAKDTSDEDSLKAFLIPMTFIYPASPEGIGDSWTEKVKAGSGKDDRSFIVNMKADSLDKVGDVDALKVTEDLTQNGPDGEKATSTWWVGKDGKVLKFDLHITNWVVPIAGDTSFAANITGSLAESN